MREKSAAGWTAGIICGVAACTLIGVAVFAGSPVYGHVESGPMPDAIAEMEYRILLEFKPEDTLTRNRLAMVLYRLDKLDEAEAELNLLLRMAPNDADALDAMGLLRSKQERYLEAIDYFQRATTANAEDRMAWYHLGIALQAAGRHAEAESALATAVEKARQSRDEQTALLADRALEVVRNEQAVKATQGEMPP